MPRLIIPPQPPPLNALILPLPNPQPQAQLLQPIAPLHQNQRLVSHPLQPKQPKLVFIAIVNGVIGHP